MAPKSRKRGNRVSAGSCVLKYIEIYFQRDAIFEVSFEGGAE